MTSRTTRPCNRSFVRPCAWRVRSLTSTTHSRTRPLSTGLRCESTLHFVLLFLAHAHTLCSPLVLHPAYKDKYFCKAGWPEEWIQEALRLACDEWKAHYKPVPKLIPVPRTKPGRRSAAASVRVYILLGGISYLRVHFLAITRCSRAFLRDPRAR